MKEPVVTRNIQFQKGISLAAFQKLYGTEDKCRAALQKDRWPRGFVCPRCGSTRGHALHARPVVQCGGCRKQTSLTANTLFHSTKLPLTTWFLALYFITQTKTGMSTLELSRHLGVQQNTAWLILHKIMSAMADREADRRLEANIEVDDAYIGGRLHDQKVGRGSPNKVPFVLAVEKTLDGNPRRIVVSVLEGFRKPVIARWMKTHVAPGSRVESDGLSCFRAAAELGHDHRPVSVKGDRAILNTKFFWSSTVLGNLKTSLLGVYHKAKHKYLPRFFGLFQYRFNRRMNLEWLMTGTFRLAARSGQRPLWVLRVG
jgi:hypothetical protein